MAFRRLDYAWSTDAVYQPREDLQLAVNISERDVEDTFTREVGVWRDRDDGDVRLIMRTCP